MPKSLKVHPNERIDLEDFVRAANDLTNEKVAFSHKELLLAGRSRFVEGFRVEVSDQTTSPGELTVYNGLAFDRTGNTLNNEDQPDDSRTITLIGSSQTFYLEIEFTEEESDPDARAFWDAVYDNPSPDPDGREFSLTVPTRISQNWRIVNPVSTSGFESTTVSSSTRIPVAIIKTNASNQIGSSGALVMAYVNAASVLEEDVVAGAGSVRVLNSRLLPAAGTVVIDGETVTVSANDFDSNTLTFTPVLASDHSAGSIVVETGTARFIQENTDPSLTAVESTATQPDAARRIFQGSEVRGSAVAASKDVADGRDDLNIRSIKDYADFMAAHVREMRWGTMRPDNTSGAAVPMSFDAPRYFDHAGGIMGSRAHTLSIGDGVNSWGDLNGDTDAVFTAAIAAMPSSGGIIFVKRGTYTFSAGVTVSKPILFIGEHEEAVSIVKTGAITYAFSMVSLQRAGLFNMEISGDGTITDSRMVSIALGGACDFENVTVLGTVYVFDIVGITAKNCRFTNTSVIDGHGLFLDGSSGLSNSHFTECTFAGSGTGMAAVFGDTDCSLSTVAFIDCAFTGETCLDMADGTFSQVDFSNCSISGTNTAIDMSGSITAVGFSACTISSSGAASSALVTFDGTLTTVSVDNCYFGAASWNATGGVISPNAFIHFGVSSVLQGVNVNNSMFNGPAGTAYVAGIVAVTPDIADYALRVDGCDFKRCMGVFVASPTAASSILVSSCNFNGDGQNRTNFGVYVSTTARIAVMISNSVFNEQTDATSAVAPVYCDFGSSGSSLSMNSCNISSPFQTAGSYAAGVYVNSISSAPMVSLVNCQLYTIRGQTGAYGLWMDSTGTPTIRVSNCFINTITAVTSGNAVGIYAPSCSKSTISDNRILTISGVSASRCIWLTTPTDVVVTGNVLEDQVHVTGIVTRLSVVNNEISVNANLSTEGIVNIVYSDGSIGLKVDNNNVSVPSSYTSRCVRLAGSSGTAALHQASVCSNNFHSFNANGTIGVDFSSGESFGTRICLNSFRETAFNANTQAIQVGSATASGHRNLVVEGNSVYWTTKTALKAGAISIDNGYAATITGNIVNIGAGAYACAGIFVEDCVATIVGNMVVGDGSGSSAYIYGTGPLLNVMVAGNTVGATYVGAIEMDGVDYDISGSVPVTLGGAGVYGFNNPDPV